MRRDPQTSRVPGVAEIKIKVSEGTNSISPGLRSTLQGKSNVKRWSEEASNLPANNNDSPASLNTDSSSSRQLTASPAILFHSTFFREQSKYSYVPS